MSATRLLIQKIVGWTMLVAGLLWTVGTTYLGWLLRDGLGPDMIETTGFAAIEAFLSGWWYFPALGLVAAGLGVFLLATGRRAPDNSFGPKPLRGSA
jgi:hypothetical protein